MSKEKKMTAKMFLYKAGTKAANSAVGFLSAHRAFLETGELAEVTSPILRLMDEKQVLPTPALDLIRHAVLTHMIQSEIAKSERAMEEQRAEEEGGFRTGKAWISCIKDEKGNIVETANSKGEIKELQQGFDLNSAAERWVDRRLFEGASDWHGEVAHATLTSAKDGLPLTIIINRQDSIARILKKPKGPTIHRKSESTQKLSFGTHCKTTRVTFSHG